MGACVASVLWTQGLSRDKFEGTGDQVGHRAFLLGRSGIGRWRGGGFNNSRQCDPWLRKGHDHNGQRGRNRALSTHVLHFKTTSAHVSIRASMAYVQSSPYPARLLRNSAPRSSGAPLQKQLFNGGG